MQNETFCSGNERTAMYHARHERIAAGSSDRDKKASTVQRVLVQLLADGQLHRKRRRGLLSR
jgi:hypothetical protein